jgi:SAM-dependent methyltransferase
MPCPDSARAKALTIMQAIRLYYILICEVNSLIKEKRLLVIMPARTAPSLVYGIQSRLSHALRAGLSKVYGFESWHKYYRDKPYARAIIAYCNSLPMRGSVLEIGCGLGDIIRRLRFDTKTGYDRSPEVVRAARIFSALTFANTKFREFDFIESAVDGSYDVIIMVNWLHDIAAEKLAPRIRRIFQCNLKPGGRLIIDTIANNPDYPFNHDILELTGDAAGQIMPLGEFAFGRRVYICASTPPAKPEQKIRPHIIET